MKIKQLPPEFSDLDDFSPASSFLLLPEKGPRYMYTYEIGTRALAEDSPLPNDYEPNIYFRDFETNVRICGKVTAEPESSSTFSVEFDGIYDMLTYWQDKKPRGHTAVSCGLILPIKYFNPQIEKNDETARIMANIVFDCAVELGHNEQGPLLEAAHEVTYKLDEPFTFSIKALSAFRTKDPVLDVLSRTTDSHLSRLQDVLKSPN